MQDRGFNSFAFNMIKLSVDEKKKRAVCSPGPALLFFVFRFENLMSGPKSYRDFRETDPRAQLFEGRLTRVSFSFDQKLFLG